jgi:branched-chain amino acid transport system ATP-binding protein
VTTPAPLLSVRGLTKSFGGAVAVSDVSFDVAAGESVGLIGPNGAGKTTVCSCIFGQMRPDAGSVRFCGRELGRLATWRRARLGIGRTYQRVEVFPEMTVRDHLLVALRVRHHDARLWRDLLGRSAPRADELARVEEVLEIIGLSEVAEVPAAALGLGTCRLVELARAIVAEPRLLLADEPSSGLDEHETRELAAVLGTLQATRGMAVLLVEHDVSLVDAVVDRAIVMDLGRVVASGTFGEVMAEPAVRRAYLGVP